jgi:hypothetical protein
MSRPTIGLTLGLVLLATGPISAAEGVSLDVDLLPSNGGASTSVLGGCNSQAGRFVGFFPHPAGHCIATIFAIITTIVPQTQVGIESGLPRMKIRRQFGHAIGSKELTAATNRAEQWGHLHV